ncbi:MAG: hypothetical protein IPL65_04530 [Lewinellaceae bacterium]|nr:hypothetical protein [Lewinellaceae bacterium]
MRSKVFLVLAVLLFSAPFLFFLLQSVAVSWRYPEVLPAVFSMQTWWLALKGAGLAASLKLAVALAGLVALVATISGFLMGKMLVKHPKKHLLIRLAYLPYAFSPVVYAFCLQFFFSKRNCPVPLQALRWRIF